MTSRRMLWLVVTMIIALVGSALVSTPASAQASEDPGDAPTIIGGSETAAGEFGYQVALLTAGTADNYQAQICGGSLIGARFVLTASHCVVGSSPSAIDVLVGTQDLSSGGQRIDVTAINMHPNYNNNTLVWDFAVLELAEDATGVAPVAFAAPTDSAFWPASTTATVTGWGNTSTTGSNFPSRLRKAEVPIVADPACQSAYPAGDIQLGTMFCAGFLGTGGVDSCQGDSGGPLVVPGAAGSWLQVGIVSWGYDCADPVYPGVYSRIESAYEWIQGFLPVATAPAITGVSPSNGTTTGGTTVTLTGTGFTGATNIRFGATDAPDYTVVDDTTITTTTPARSAGLVNIYVTTPGGTSPATAWVTWFNYKSV